MTDPHTQATRGAVSVAQAVPHRASCPVCGHCGSNITVESGSLAHYVRCPSCAHRVKVTRFVSRRCEYCGVQCRIDLTDGSMVAACDNCGRSYAFAAVVAPTPKHYRQSYRSYRRRGADFAAMLCQVAILILLLYVLVRSAMGLLGSGG